VPKAEEDIPAPECAERDKALATKFEPYADAFSNYGIEISPDGKTLLFLSNRGGGSVQLYVAAARNPRAKPTVIAQAKDRVGAARFTPDGKHILFTRDKDHDENFQIYRATVDGGEVVPLTTKPERIHHLPRVTPDGKTLIYFRGSHRSRYTTLVSQPLEGGEAKKIKRLKGLYFLSDLSPDGSRALVFTLTSLSESKLGIVDLKSGKIRKLAPSKGSQAHANRAVFDADGKTIYVVTDEGGERAGVHIIDAKDGEVKSFYYEPKSEVSDLEICHKANLVAAEVNMGSHQSVRLLEGGTLKEKVKVRLPLGGVHLGRFTADCRGLVVTVSTPDRPTDAFLVDTRYGRVRPLRRDFRKGLRRLTRIKASSQTIPSFDKKELPFNLYLPRRLPRRKKLPVIVSVHGGPAAVSSIRWNPMVGFWISLGFAVVEPNVRGSTGFGKAYEMADNGGKRMDAVKDLAELNRWIRQQRWADPDRIVVYGGSYGGYMTYMALGHQPDLWRAGVGLVGVVNLASLIRTTSGTLRQMAQGEFGSLKKDRELLRQLSPISVIDKIEDPVFVYQGANDPRVPRSEQDQLVNTLRKRGVAVEYMLVGDEGHSMSHRPTKLQFAGRSVRFLEQHLELPGPSDECKSTIKDKGAGGAATPADAPAEKAAPAKKAPVPAKKAAPAKKAPGRGQ
jgi:dipeptidyl aminopeptidase/acylaminoacyl peptidase